MSALRTTNQDQMSKFIKDIENTIEVMTKNKLPSTKKQVIPPLYDFIPYCQDRRSQPTKRHAAEEVKRFYQVCNSKGVYTDTNIVYKMVAIIRKGRQCQTSEERYALRCEQMSEGLSLGVSRSSHADAKKQLLIKKEAKLKQFQESIKKDMIPSSIPEKKVILKLEKVEIPDSWDDSDEE